MISQRLTLVKRAYSQTTQSSSKQSFDQIINEIDSRLARSRLNTTNRNLAYRPRRAKELLSRKDPIIVNNEPLEPRKWDGVPGKKMLLDAIKSVSSSDEFSQVKNIIREYSEYYPQNLDQKHAKNLLRQGSILGLYNDANTFSQSQNLRQVLNQEYYKEQLRIHALRLKYTEGGEVKLDGINKLVEKVGEGVEGALLKVVCLNNLASVSSTETIKNELDDAIKFAQTELITHESIVENTSRQNMGSLLITFKLASDAFKQNGADVGKLDQLVAKAGSNLKNHKFIEGYINNIEEGCKQEMASKRAASTETEGDAEGDA